MPWPTERDTELFAVIDRELERQNTGTPADRVGELHLACGHGGRRLGADQQVLRGLPGQALLRRQRVRRRGRGPRPPNGSARCSARSTPTCSPTPGRTPTSASTWRCWSRATPCSGLSLDHGGHLTHGSPVNISGRFYDFVSYGLTPQRRADRPRPAPRPGPRAPPEDDRRRCHRLRPRIIDPAPIREICDEVGALFMFDAAHIAGLIAGWGAPQPGRGGRRGHLHHPQDAARPARAAASCPPRSTPRRSTRPSSPGCRAGRSSTSIAGKAVAFREAAHPSFSAYAHQIVANARALADALGGHGFRLVSGGTDNHLMLIDLRPFDAELTGKDAQIALDARRHHPQQEHRARRPAQPVRHLRAADRHARRSPPRAWPRRRWPRSPS